MGKFKKGDTVKIIKVIDDVGHFKVGDILIWDCPEPGGCIEASHELAVKRGAPAIDPTYYKFKKIGGTMNKYEELKERIGEVEGWDSSSDAILQELDEGKGHYWLQICCFNGMGSAILVKDISCKDTSVNKASFTFRTQCEKLEAFKKSLLWILDHSKLAKENEKKTKKRDALQKQLDKIQSQLNEL